MTCLPKNLCLHFFFMSFTSCIDITDKWQHASVQTYNSQFIIELVNTKKIFFFFVSVVWRSKHLNQENI